MSFPSDIFARMFTDKNTQLLYPKEEVPSHDVEDIVQTNLFNVMLNRRSQRKFENRDVEEWKLEMILQLQIRLLQQADSKVLRYII